MNPRRDSKGLEKTRKGSVKDTEVFHKHAPDHRASPLPVPQRLVLFILSILCIHVQYVENGINGTWSLFPKRFTNY